MNEIIDVCSQALGDNWQDFHRLAYYSHLIPISLSIFLGILVFFKAKRTIFSKIFLAFSSIFSLWLLGDLITWTSKNYYLIYASWSLLVYLEILFFALGLYFAIIFIRQDEISLKTRLVILTSTLVPFFVTLTGNSVTGFNYPVCEAFNNTFLDSYKLCLEILILGVIFACMIIPFFNKKTETTKKSNLVVLGSLFFFLAIFGVTEYIAAITGFYELNLYALLVIPVFLIAITYSVFSLDIFDLKILSTYFLVFGFLILIATQLLLVTSSTNRLLTVMTLLLASSFSVLLFRNLKRESDQRIQIANLNIDLQKLVKQRESLMHLINHKVKGAFTHSKYIFAGILDGTFGDINEEIKKRAQQGLDSDEVGIKTIDLVLNAANLQKGIVKYEMKEVDFKDIVLKVFAEKKDRAEAKGLKIEKHIKDDTYNVLGDAFWLKEVVNNLLENSIRYTKDGEIDTILEKKDGEITFTVKDTGVGISDEDKKVLFTEGGRGKESVKINTDSTGYGLYSVKLILDSHKGNISAESQGVDKGSTFKITLPSL